MNKQEQIRKMKVEYSTEKNKIFISRQKRLAELVALYGFEDVAEAGGYTYSTLVQYLRMTEPKSIGEDSVKQAEFILNQLR